MTNNMNVKLLYIKALLSTFKSSSISVTVLGNLGSKNYKTTTLPIIVKIKSLDKKI